MGSRAGLQAGAGCAGRAGAGLGARGVQVGAGRAGTGAGWAAQHGHAQGALGGWARRCDTTGWAACARMCTLARQDWGTVHLTQF